MCKMDAHLPCYDIDVLENDQNLEFSAFQKSIQLFFAAYVFFTQFVIMQE